MSSLQQVCFGAVQRTVLAHVQSSHPGPYFLPSHPLYGAHSVVQYHHEYTLIGKELVLSGSVPSPATSVRGTCCTLEIAHILFFRPVSTVPHCDALGRHMFVLQCSWPQRLLDTSLMDLGTPISSDFQPVCGVCSPQPLVHRKWWLSVACKRETEETVSFCTRVCVFSLCLKTRATEPFGWNPLVFGVWPVGYLNSIIWDFLKIRTSSSTWFHTKFSISLVLPSRLAWILWLTSYPCVDSKGLETASFYLF